MRNTITKTVSMFLVAVMVMGIAVMPMRADAAFEISTTFGANPVTLTLDIINIVAKMGLEMTSGVNNGHPLPETVATFAAYWEPYVTSNVILLTQQQMSELMQGMKVKGITVEGYRRNDFPAEYMIIRLVSTTVNGIDLSDEVDFGSFYTFKGMTVACKVDSSSASQNPTNKYTEDDGSEQETVLTIDPETQELIEVTVTNAVKNAMAEYLATINVSNNTAYDVTNNSYSSYTDMSYNPTTKTYQVNFSDNRSYTYNFYYDYTYITYIGSSAEYREAYKVYYELSDGRSSGDLTADELKGLSLQFDMVNYDKAASDTLTQALYPFDGNLDNTSYFDANGYWVNTSGYSFLESPEPFGGYLYSPVSDAGSVNLFRVDLPSSYPISDYSDPNSSSFTLQCRFYLDGKLGTNGGGSPASSVAIGFIGPGSNEQYTYFFPAFYLAYNSNYSGIRMIAYWAGGSSGYSNIDISVGVWHDLCLVCDESSYYFYLDGIRYGDGSFVPSNVVSVWLDTDDSLHDWSWQQRIGFHEVTGFGFFNGNSSIPIAIDNMRFVSAPLYSGVSTITVPQAPFDTNLVYVLPSVAELNANTVAIMSQLPVSGYRVGGVRPTSPLLAVGYIYMHVNGEFVDSVQQWNGAYWEEVTARLYTGVRWIPVTAFNVYTLEDMFDIIDPDADGGGNSVDSIYQYYLWWSGEWGSFQQWLQGTMQTLIEAIQSSNGGGGSGPVVIVPGLNDQTTTNEITTENPDGSTTKTVIVSNAAGLVYSNSVTTYPTDAEGNTKTITVYTDSSGVMYQTTTIIDKDGNVTVTEPTQATGTLGAIFKMITSGVMSIAGTVIEGFVTIVVDGVKFIIESADSLFTGIGNLITSAANAVTDATTSFIDILDRNGNGTGDTSEYVDGETPVPILQAIFDPIPAQLKTIMVAFFVVPIVFALFGKIHF